MTKLAPEWVRTNEAQKLRMLPLDYGARLRRMLQLWKKFQQEHCEQSAQWCMGSPVGCMKPWKFQVGYSEI